MREGEGTDWYYTILKDGQEYVNIYNGLKTSYTLPSTRHSGEYQCFGRHKTIPYYQKQSNKVSLTVAANRPKAELRLAYRDIPIGANVTLKCSVTSPSSGWKYFWYRGKKTSEALTTQDVVFLSNETIRVSKGGVYCWPKIYYGEMITLRCEIENGEDTEWKYEWSMYSSYTHKKQNENAIRFVQSSQTGRYMCLGRTESEMSTTQCSDPFILTLSDTLPLPVLTVSPSWLNAGDSVTLNCEVEHPSAGWRFYWYKTVPKLPGNDYSPELLPDSSNGTEQDSYIVHGQTGTAGYVCRAGRGDPVYYTFYSQPKFVWSGDRNILLLSPAHPVTEGDPVSLSCKRRTGIFDSNVFFYRNDELIQNDARKELNISAVSKSDEGFYKCQHSGEESSQSWMTFVTRRQNWTQIYSGETIDVRCEIKGRGHTDWTYEWRTSSSNTPPAHSEYRIKSASHNGLYWCKGRRDLYSSTEWSQAFSLTVLSHKPKPKVMADRRTIPDGRNGNLTCSLENPAEWNYYWFRRHSALSESEIIRDGDPDRVISISQGGIYHCRGGRGSPVFFTEDSDPVAIEKRVSNKPVVSLRPNWPLIFSGEAITITCRINENAVTVWEYEWSKPNSNTSPTDDEYRISSATVSDSGDYKCVGKHKRDTYSSTEWSDVATLIVSSNRPKAELSADDRNIPVGGSVTLTCSVKPSSPGWKYFWYRGEKPSEPLTTQDVLLSTGQFSVSQEGVYRCRGGRGEPVYYTEYSDSISINKMNTYRAVVTLQPNWSKIFSGETITLRCEIKNGGGAEWEYEWIPSRSYYHPNQNEYKISSVSFSHHGQYWCKGRMKGAGPNSTGWSNAFQLTVSSKPLPVLTVSPSWLNAGDSVTLNCEVEHPSAGWRFYWYKTVPKLPDRFILYHHGYPYGFPGVHMMDRRRFYNPYSYELLSGSNNGTEQASYVIHGQTHTAGYVCRAGRGVPVYYTDYSEEKFVWSAEPIAVQPVIIGNATWHNLYQSCIVLLECSVPTVGSVSYNWTVRNQTRRGSRLQHEIKMQDGDTRFTCTAYNLVSEMSASETFKCSNVTKESGTCREVTVVYCC
ncbi:Fc receptor-like protein 5 [Nibea albiflora]|uniref:Fc receptor-like protein 5 n=1 Tax=Nibea albiflora TaxID=240163 RepID=A0ACB7EUZ5_NIBAL|nr:Fc receptor-like protein 5 [Nibea albiflora]